jgi:hypothetical protein
MPIYTNWIPLYISWQNVWYLCFAFWDARADCDTVYCVGAALIRGKMKKTNFYKEISVAFLWGEDVDGWLFNTAVTDEVKCC